jgi:hypothetical protein
MSDISNGNRDPMTGHFRLGNKLGGQGGNPNAKRMAELKKALVACGTEQDIQDIYKTLMAAALGGDVQAAKLLLDHLVGRPSQSVEISGFEGDPVKLDMQNLTATLLVALKAFPEAKIAVARALYSIGHTKPEGAVSDEPGSVNGD